MESVNVKNDAGTQWSIDGILYELPYRIHIVFDFKESFVFYSYPTPIDSEEIMADFESQGKYCLWGVSKKTKEVIWKMKGVNPVRKTCVPLKKDESWFGSEECYQKYLKELKQKEILIVHTHDGYFAKSINPLNGAVIDSWETR
jgi:hypothetical protein